MLHLESEFYNLIHLWGHVPADAAGGEEEPVHEDPGAVVVGVIGQEAVPLVALLAGAVAGAARGALLPAVTGLRTSQTNESVK